MTFGAIREKRDPKPTEKNPRQQESLFTRIREMIQGPVYRRFLLVQMLLVPVTQGLVFFSIFGRREFHLDIKALGLLILTDAIAPLAGNAFWGKVADRKGNGFVLSAAGFLSMAAPAIAIFLYFAGRELSGGIVFTLFALVVFALGIVSVGVDLASKNFILELAPDSKRPVYIGVNDTLIALPTMLLAGGGHVLRCSCQRALDPSRQKLVLVSRKPRPKRAASRRHCFDGWPRQRHQKFSFVADKLEGKRSPHTASPGRIHSKSTDLQV